MKKIFYFSLILIASCIKSVPLEIEESEQTLVVNSLISPDSNIIVFVNTTISMLESNSKNINPKVELFENDNYITILDKNIDGIYSTNYIPVASKQYKIKITESNFETCTAIDTIPEKVIIQYATFFLPAGFDESGTPYYEATINFNDSVKISNYYEIVIYSGDEENPDNYITELLTTNNSIINEGNQEYFPTSLFFSDILFDGNSKILPIGWTKK